MGIGFIHARLSPEEQTALQELTRATGMSASELVRRGLRLISEELRRQRIIVIQAAQHVKPRRSRTRVAQLLRMGEGHKAILVGLCEEDR